MSTKKEVMTELTAKGISYNPNDSKDELSLLLATSFSTQARKAYEEDTLDVSAKNLAEKPKPVAVGEIDPSVGDLTPAKSTGLITEEVTRKKLKELEAEGRLYGFCPTTMVASYKK